MEAASVRIGIIGAGNMGSALARRWIKAGHTVSLSFARNTATLNTLAAELGPNASVASPAEAASSADVVLLSVPYDALDDAITAIGSPNAPKPLITTVSPYAADFTGSNVDLVSRLGSHSAAEEIATRLPTLHVVEAFNLTFADLIAQETLPFDDIRPTVPLCGDNASAKQMVASLIDDAGLTSLDVGSLRVARTLEPMATAWVQLAAVSGLFPMTGLSVLQPQSQDFSSYPPLKVPSL
jgi:8-hydroxy-5-deazaflavin:NADPH oxidoreductase